MQPKKRLTGYMNGIISKLAIVAVVTCAQNAQAQEKIDERGWSEIINKTEFAGETEYFLPDNMRADIVTETHAYEVEWASKWKESIGQALYYAIHTERKPGVILLCNSSAKDKVSYLRLMTVASKYQISVMVVNTEKYLKEHEITRQ